MKRQKEEKPRICAHDNTFPIVFFDEQEFADWAYLIVECEECGEKFPLVGKRFGSE